MADGPTVLKISHQFPANTDFRDVITRKFAKEVDAQYVLQVGNTATSPWYLESYMRDTGNRTENYLRRAMLGYP